MQDYLVTVGLYVEWDYYCWQRPGAAFRFFSLPFIGQFLSFITLSQIRLQPFAQSKIGLAHRSNLFATSCSDLMDHLFSIVTTDLVAQHTLVIRSCKCGGGRGRHEVSVIQYDSLHRQKTAV